MKRENSPTLSPPSSPSAGNVRWRLPADFGLQLRYSYFIDTAVRELVVVHHPVRQRVGLGPPNISVGIVLYLTSTGPG